ncbi:MAG: 16S rRNA (cytosine(967)-C(5))-methyltransferase RsmB [Burkholderiaceae bacterium]|nr:16S rRNA (cytosine(967)-C(5))-methyltransferase RsmB [Burkholderiaceae bacterium]
MHIKRSQDAIPLWRQLQSTASVLMAVRAGESGTAALKTVEASLRPGVQALSFHVWRWLGTAQIIRTMLAKRAPPPQVDALLCVALTLLCFDAPVFAKDDNIGKGEKFGLFYDAFTLVDQTVEAAKRNPNTKASSSFINACLRRFLREKLPMTMAASADLVGRWNHPLWWINRVKADHPQDWQGILQSNNERAPLTLRVNARKSDVASYLSDLAAMKIEAKKVGKYGVTLAKATPVTEMLGFSEGVVSVQDAAAQLAVPLLMNGLEGGGNLRVLDACAAPGGKTAHLLEISDCHVTALDIDAARCDLIHGTLNRLGLTAHVLAADAARPETWRGEAGQELFDAILLDAPCTASGIVRRHPDIRWLRRETDVEQLADIQRKLLETLWGLLKPGGRLLYCTCSVFKAEGQTQIDLFITNNKNAVLLPSPGHLISKSAANLGFVADNALTNHDGFFYALLEKPAP